MLEAYNIRNLKIFFKIPRTELYSIMLINISGLSFTTLNILKFEAQHSF